jgi:hypothetical protein
MNMLTKSLLLAFALTFVAGLSGCLSSSTEPFTEWQADERYHDYVPEGAKPVASGAGVLTFTAPDRGTLYLLDTTDKMTVREVQVPRGIGSGLLNKGDKVTFDPAQKRAWKEGGEGVKFSKVDPTHTHELRFEPTKKNENW